MLIAQISDLHFSTSRILGGRVDTEQMTSRAVDACCAFHRCLMS